MSLAGNRAPLVGILGGGQLGRMLALAGIPLGARFRFLEPQENPPVLGLGEVIRGGYDDPSALVRFRQGLDAVTYEFENVPAEVVEELAREVPVFPSPGVLARSQDRVDEKETFRRAGIRTADFLAVDSREALDRAVASLGLPAVLKTRRFGYDGKGQWILRAASDADRAWAESEGRPLILEAFIPFERELSILVARGTDGRLASYPPGGNVHRDGILRTTRAPAPGLSPTTAERAREIGERLSGELGYVGLLAVELFDVGGELLANEFAPRVHNSGHWTQDGAVTCQFENHLRAGLGLPLGSTEPLGWSGMVNLIGRLPDLGTVLGMPGARLHLYGKEPRPGRKLGHVNLVRSRPEDLERDFEELLALIDD